MRHRAPTVLSRVRDVSQRRGLAAGAVAVLGVSACAGLVAVNGHDFGDLAEGDTLTAGVLPELRTGTTYPDAAALETMAAERDDAAADRGDARTSPSEEVSEVARERADAGTPSPQATQATQSTAPGTDTPKQPADDPSPAPDSPSSPDARETASPSQESSASAPATGPETTAVTDVSAAGTWTVVLTSDRVASFECSLDGGAWTPCGPVATFTGLSQGRHTLAVRAVDGAGTADPTPAELSTTLNGPLP